VSRPLVSAIIPTFNRRDDVVIAVQTVIDQTYPAASLEIVVVDDGGTDDTAAALTGRFGERVRLLRKTNGGVSSARNHGLAAANGAYLALLDSDDEWRPTKIARQVEFLERHPTFGMVITDVERMNPDRQAHDVFRRRDQLPEDGWNLPRVLRNPSLAPASAMLTRAAYDSVGGFDVSLRTAEDLDYHLRVALRWPIGVIAEPLTRAMRGHDGLSALGRTYRDYLAVVERFVDQHGDQIAPRDRDAALLRAYALNARGLLYDGEVVDALRYAARSVARGRGRGDARILGALGVYFAKGLGVRARRRILGS